MKRYANIVEARGSGIRIKNPRNHVSPRITISDMIPRTRILNNSQIKSGILLLRQSYPKSICFKLSMDGLRNNYVCFIFVLYLLQLWSFLSLNLFHFLLWFWGSVYNNSNYYQISLKEIRKSNVHFTVEYKESVANKKNIYVDIILSVWGSVELRSSKYSVLPASNCLIWQNSMIKYWTHSDI